MRYEQLSDEAKYYAFNRYNSCVPIYTADTFFNICIEDILPVLDSAGLDFEYLRESFGFPWCSDEILRYLNFIAQNEIEEHFCIKEKWAVELFYFYFNNYGISLYSLFKLENTAIINKIKQEFEIEGPYALAVPENWEAEFEKYLDGARVKLSETMRRIRAIIEEDIFNKSRFDEFGARVGKYRFLEDGTVRSFDGWLYV